MDLSRNRLRDLLNLGLRALSLPTVMMDALPSVETRKQEFLRVLRTERVTELEVDGLEGRDIPVDVKIFNPDADKEKLFREVYQEHESPNLASAKLKASRQGNLGRSKYAKMISEAGSPNKLRYVEATIQSETVEIRRRVTTHLGDIEVSEQITEDDILKIVRIFEEKTATAGPIRARPHETPEMDMGRSHDSE